MTKNKNHKAFSLIEISMVILVIGILIAGISQGIDLYDDYRLASARNLTKNSLVNRIPDLEMWLETTSENSLATGTASFTDKPNPTDQDSIGRWNNINPNILPSARNHATQNNPTALVDNQPKYIRKGMNGLPALLFDGIDDYIASETKFITNNFTIFVVGLPSPNTTCSSITPQAPGVTGQRYIIYPQHGNVIFPSNNAAGAGISLCTNFVSGFEHASGYMPYSVSNAINSISINKPIQITLKYDERVPNLYLNSTYSFTGGTSPKNVFPSLTFGGGRLSGYAENYGYFKGSIAEIIIYSRALTDKERQGVEAYLAKKWGIKIG
jgi:prepilin-type N-terminal cleavage/methylation domain-containing protein